MATANQMRKELKTLSGNVKSNIFQMAKIASKLSKNESYVEKMGGEDAFFESLDDNEFSHFGKNPRAYAIVVAYEASPSESVWKENNYSLVKMIDIARGPVENRGPRTNWKSKYHELEDHCKSLEKQLEHSRKLVESLESSLAAVKKENSELKGHFDDLRSQVSRLEGALEQADKMQRV